MFDIHLQVAFSNRKNVTGAKDLEDLQAERRKLQQDIKQERLLLERLKKERSELEMEVRKLRAAKDQQEKRLRWERVKSFGFDRKELTQRIWGFSVEMMLKY